MYSVEPVTVLTLVSAALVGVTLALLGTFKVALANHPRFGGDRARRYLLLLNLTAIPAIAASGLAVDQFGVRPVLVVGSILLSIGLAAFGAGLATHNQTIGVLFAGAGAAALGTATIVLFPRGLFGHYQMLASMHMGLVFVGLGALLTPVITGLLFRKLRLRRTLALWAVAALAPAFLALAVPQQSLEPFGEPRTTMEVLTNPAVWTAGLVYLFYAPLEAAISLWVNAHFPDPTPGDRRVRWHLLFFWTGFLVTRLLFALTAQAGYPDDRWDRFFLVIPPLLVPVLLGTLSGHVRRGWAATEMFGLGVLLGPLLPVLLAHVFRLDVSQREGTAYAAVLAVGSLGGALLNPLVAFGVERKHPLQSVIVPIVLALGLTASALALSVLQ